MNPTPIYWSAQPYAEWRISENSLSSEKARLLFLFHLRQLHTAGDGVIDALSISKCHVYFSANRQIVPAEIWIGPVLSCLLEFLFQIPPLLRFPRLTATECAPECCLPAQDVVDDCEPVLETDKEIRLGVRPLGLG